MDAGLYGGVWCFRCLLQVMCKNFGRLRVREDSLMGGLGMKCRPFCKELKCLFV